uniref:BON domain-containing protein n=1 Tax=Schlesneria paludicola TaxID=360056 RepID=A0A7C2K2G2_9PLAN
MVAFNTLRHWPADRELERRVASELSAADPIRFRHVNVSARSGVVVLLGTVATYYAKSLGFQRAQRIPGVASVVDALRVDAGPVTATALVDA